VQVGLKENLLLWMQIAHSAHSTHSAHTAKHTQCKAHKHTVHTANTIHTMQSTHRAKHTKYTQSNAHIIVICAKYIQQSTLKAGYLPGIQDYGSGGVKCGAFLHTEKAEEGDQAVFPLSFASCSQTICSTHDHRSPV
jgi:hypothetical protein